MFNKDMVAFVANTNTVQVMDLFSYGESRPPSDSQNDYTDVKVIPIGGGRFNVTASRLLDTKDKYEDT